MRKRRAAETTASFARVESGDLMLE
jgi:hypothetical protein